MSEAAAWELLDTTCAELVGEFSLDKQLEGFEDSVTFRDIDLSLGMCALDLTYRNTSQQLKFYEEHDEEYLRTLGNPSARISTYTAESQLAHYNFDGRTGLVVVNPYPFPDGDTRQLEPSDMRELSLSIAGSGIANSHVMNRVLTNQGIRRITRDLRQLLETAK